MCGIVGILGTNESSLKAHEALLILQHRGQDSAGITSYDSKSAKFTTHKDMGQVSEVFHSKALSKLKGEVSIGHTRYSTIGEVKESDLQPMMVSYPYTVAMAHNGNLSNYIDLKKELMHQGHFFTSDNDLEVLLHLLTQQLSKSSETDFFDKLCFAVTEVLKKAEGGYSVIATIGGEGLMAFRDRHGIRPLVYGVKRNEDKTLSYCFSSETSVLDFLGYQSLGEVGPGELILVKADGLLMKKNLMVQNRLPCMFEWIYFAGPESTIEGKSVYKTRLNLGKELSKKIKESGYLDSIDVIVPVPDTSRVSAISLSEALGIPYREVLIKNRYVQRSFIQNGQDKRKMTVNLKFSVIREQVEGKNILLIDDSIVRGTTSKKIVHLLKEHGANKIFFASTCPPIISPCYYGIDFPTTSELAAASRTLKELESFLNVEKIFYTEMLDLHMALEEIGFCRACLNSDYPYPVREVHHVS